MTSAATRWTDPDWLAAANAWIGDAAARTGAGAVLAIEQPHIRPWSTALRVRTAGGDLWFKANSDAHRHEAAVTALLARARPEVVVELVAHDPETGWMLTREAGERLRELVERERSLTRWLDVLPLYAELQLAAAPLAGELLAAGAPDRRLAVLPERFEQLLGRIERGHAYRRLVPLVADRCERLAAYAIAETIQHDDLHDAQVFVRDGRYLVTDWGDAVVSHPFFSMSVTLEGVIAFGVDDVEGSEDVAPYAAAYLAPFGDGLEDALALAVPLGWACRCVGVYDHAQALAPPDRAGMLDGLEPRLELLTRGLTRG
ncbi:MAG TPA: hypothetical protein VLB86_06275 [Gaiellaceae bacterium]|nr:hypothetical protein [Gaiellaceae bacterium]